jgi:hypothetical protein
MAVRIEKILCTVLHEAHERQVEVTMQTLSERPEGRSDLFNSNQELGGLQPLSF